MAEEDNGFELCELFVFNLRKEGFDEYEIDNILLCLNKSIDVVSNKPVFKKNENNEGDLNKIDT